MEEEIWKDIAGWEGLYQVSSFGRVRSLGKMVKGKYGNLAVKTGKILKPYVDRYCSVIFYHDGLCKTYLVHRIVAFHFHEKPDYEAEVMHLNNIKTDNHYKNLKWGTHLQNMQDGYRDKLIKVPFGWQRPNGKYKREVYKKVYDLHNSGKYNNEQIGRIIGVSSGTIFKWLKTYKKHKIEIDKIMSDL